MTPTELASLEALAKAAPAAWYWVAQQGSHLFPVWVMGSERPYEAPNNAMPLYAAPSNPAAILSLIEENKRMREALTPSAETKAAYIGEFRFSVLEYVDDDGTEYESEFTVPWTTIKEIMAAIRARAALGARP